MSIFLQKQQFRVVPCQREEIKEFIEKWHYSKSINGVKSSYCFKLLDNESIIGAMIFGRMGMANTWKKFVNNECDLLELRRLCCIDDTPQNTESFFISKCLKWIKQNTNVKKIVSYADMEYNHYGIIYKASNFINIGNTPKQRVIFFNGKTYHDKSIRTKYKGNLKPFAKKLKNELDKGNAEYRITKGKCIFLYSLR